MTRPTKPVAAVIRLNPPSHRGLEALGAGALLLVMLGLFLIVRPEPVQSHPMNAFAATDFRTEAPEGATSARTGRITANVAPVDAFEVLGASPQDARAASAALRQAAPALSARLRAGAPFIAYFDDADTGQPAILTGVNLRIDPKTTLSATRRDDGTFFASVLEAKTTLALKRVKGVIITSLADAVEAEGATRMHAATLASLFPEDPRLAKGGRPGERFDIVIEVITDERGNFLETGDLVFAAFNGESTAGSWYRFTPEDSGLPDFFGRNGVAGDEFLIRDPVRSGDISSGFGNRIHPITGEMTPHTGIDFRAPQGTPIRAAGTGLVTDMRYSDGYGWFVRIQHERGFETVYAHMSAFADGLTPGQTVLRGDTIGFVGDTGSATGSHLHFEVLRNGAYVNPMTLELPSGRDLSRNPAAYAAFKARRDAIDAFRNASEAGGPLLTAALKAE